MTEPTTRITHIATVIVPVADQDTALGFYRDTLGFEVRIDGGYGEGQRWIEVAPPGPRRRSRSFHSDRVPALRSVSRPPTREPTTRPCARARWMQTRS
jgi:catechol 2,3-dioxygenase-like lactoylglutathione lyase family enzyme